MQTACITVRVWNEISQKRSNSGRLLLLKVSAFAHPFGLVANVFQKQGDTISMVHLGVSYFNRESVNKDRVKAAELYLKAATLGHVGAMKNMGFCYFNGDGVEQDWKQALTWFAFALIVLI